MYSHTDGNTKRSFCFSAYAKSRNSSKEAMENEYNFNREFYVKRAAYIHVRVYTCAHMYKC